MRNLFNLLRIEALSFMGINKRLNKNKNKGLLGTLGVFLLLILIGGLIFFYAYYYIPELAELLLNEKEKIEIFPFAFSFVFAVSFIYEFYSIGNLLYGAKDYDLLITMPIKPNVIVLSKLLYIYLENLLISLLVVVAIFIRFNSIGGTLTLNIVIFTLIMSVFVPFLSLSFAIIVGTLFSFISSKFKRRNLVQTILFLAVFGLLYYFLYTNNGTFSINKLYLLYGISLKAFSDVIYLLIFIGINLLSFVIVYLIISVFYPKLNSIMHSQKKSRNYKLKTYKSKRPFKCLFNKEIKRFFSSPNYFINTALGPIFALIFSVLFVILIRDIAGAFGADISDGTGDFLRVFGFIVVFFSAASPTTSSSISLEGKTFWQIKTLPISFKKYFNAKLMVNVIINTLPMFIVSLVLSIPLGTELIYVVLFSLYVVSLSLLFGVLGLFYNLIFPNFEWEREQKVVKQSLPTFLCSLQSCLWIVINVILDTEIILTSLEYLLICIGFALILSIIIYSVILTKGEELLRKKTD